MRILEKMGQLIALFMMMTFLVSTLTSTPVVFSSDSSHCEISVQAACSHAADSHSEEAPVHGHHHCFSCDRALVDASENELNPILFLSSFGTSQGPSIHEDPDLHGPVVPPRA